MSIIKELRIKAGLTQAQLALKVGAKQPTIALWEADGKKCRMPNAKYMPKLSKALKCKIDVLIKEMYKNVDQG